MVGRTASGQAPVASRAHAATHLRRPSGRIVAALGLALVILLLMLGEAIPRLFELPETLARNRTLEHGMARLDDAAGYVMQPFYGGRISLQDYDEPFETNSRGLRGPELGPKQPGEFRIVVLGDSMVFGPGVRPEQRLTEQLQDLLHGHGFPSVRVVNVAIPGWTTFNEAGFLTANSAWLEPDLVVVAAYLGNDIEENVLATVGGYEWTETGIGIAFGQGGRELVRNSIDWFPHNFAVGAVEYARPYVQPNDWLESDPLPTPSGNTASATDASSASGGGSSLRYVSSSPAYAVRTWLKLHSRVYRAATDAWFVVRHGYQRPQVLNVNQWLAFTLRDQPRQYWLQMGYALTERYLVQAKAAATAVGAQTVVLLIPHDAQVVEAKRQAELGRFRLDPRDVDLERSERELVFRADRNGIPVIDLAPALRVLPDPASLTFEHDLHLTPRGHAAVAEALAAELVRRGSLPTP